MTKPNILILDCTTGKQTIRQMTNEEYDKSVAAEQTAIEAEAAE
jgi:hypothetical protein